MLLIYNTEDPNARPTAEQFRESMEAHRAVMEETKQKGIFIGAHPLKPSTTATTVRLSDDHKPLITDGPYAETKEQLAGYYLLDCQDLDEAIGYATRLRTRCAASGRVGGVEVRPIMEFSEIQQKLETLMAAQPA
jgi:hypothetical protein